MNLEFRYGVDLEVERVKKILGKILWYREQGYRPVLPENVKETSTDEEINNAITAEFRSEQYDEIVKKIELDFAMHHEEFERELRKHFSFIPDSILCRLTQFGTDGSYQVPNFIVLNIYDRRGTQTIYHEIIHLCLEDEFTRNAVSHWIRERIVDRILHAEPFKYLNYSTWQRDYHGAEIIVDHVFDEMFFSDRESFYRAVCGAR